MHLGEGDDIPDGVRTGHEHHQPVQAVGQAAVGRSAVLKGVNQMTEAGLRVLLGEAKGAEDRSLHLRSVNADGAAAQLGAVEHDVVGLGAAAALIRLQLVHVLVHGRGKGVVLGHEAVFLLGILKHGKLGDP
ncbi:hypothetical protein SDC9_141820 [bioreactor metagenome]|uniref:Uncharacterized protein n=1 Tax=bioreactor metagenome TaxID=1076179 RepID=A0A645E263_9ZZZZ